MTGTFSCGGALEDWLFELDELLDELLELDELLDELDKEEALEELLRELLVILPLDELFELAEEELDLQFPTGYKTS